MTKNEAQLVEIRKRFKQTMQNRFICVTIVSMNFMGTAKTIIKQCKIINSTAIWDSMCRISRGYFYPPVGIGMFSTGIFSMKKVTAQIFLRLYIHEFLSEFLRISKIDNRNYELYISVAAVMKIFIVREIQLLKVE